jgi:acetyl esterase/lipase
MLMGRGFAPENIIIISESAGAFASLALVRYIKELQDEGVAIGMPGAMVMASVSQPIDT